jgi:hypothetical protein
MEAEPWNPDQYRPKFKIIPQKGRKCGNFIFLSVRREAYPGGA